MKPTAFFYGDPGRLPFVGHFRATRTVGDTAVSAAGRVQAGGDLLVAFSAARAIEHAIRSAPIEQPCDRHEALGLIWQSIHAIAPRSLGSGGGADLSILFAVSDADGTGISGVGLGAVWGQNATGFEPLVEGDHPLLCGPGRPETLAGVLTLDTPAYTIVGLPYDRANSRPEAVDWQQRCGVYA